MTKLSMNSPEETRRLSITLLFCCDVKKKLIAIRHPVKGVAHHLKAYVFFVVFMSDEQNVNQFKGKNL